ncbi:putative mitogen-activated protein kinase CMGC-MAPK family [Helianthus anomalus]
MLGKEFFTEYGEASLYEIQEVVGKGSYGVVAAAVDTHTGEKVAIKKINDVFEHVSDATRILREIKLLRLLKHPDIVEIKHIMLPPCRREFKDIYVVFELMESDLDEVIKVNDDLTPEHHQFFLYQLLRALKYIHTAHVFHRDLKPKNILANADCKLKICDFGLARALLDDTPSAIFWTDYVATRWYRAPELCGSFFSKYTPAIDIWSIGCIFAEMLTGKPLFPGRNVVHQLELVTDLLGSPSPEIISRIRNDKARRYLNSMPKKTPIPFSQKFPTADPLALRLLERLIAFDPADRISAEEISISKTLRFSTDPYFYGLANLETEPSKEPISKLEFEFERRRLTKNDVRELIYREILEYHPQMLQEYLHGEEHISFMYPSGIERFKQQFADLEDQEGKERKNSPLQRHYTSLPRERICVPIEEAVDEINTFERRTNAAIASSLESPPRSERCNESKTVKNDSNIIPNSRKNPDLPRSSCTNTPKYVGPSNRSCKGQGDEVSSVLSQKLAALSS